MRIVAWNIRAGGGERVGRISRYLERWAPDAVVLSEFRATPPSLELARSLASHGLSHQCTSASRRNPRANALLVAARWPVSPLRLRAQPREPGRWLLVSVNAPRPLLLGAMHVPNRVTGRKYLFLDSVLACARRWRLGPALFLGDTNSGRRWLDAFRHLRAEARAYTWYSPNGQNGFRIDQAFVNAALLERLRDAAHVWAGTRRGRKGAPSDHAALLVDFHE